MADFKTCACSADSLSRCSDLLELRRPRPDTAQGLVCVIIMLPDCTRQTQAAFLLPRCSGVCIIFRSSVFLVMIWQSKQLGLKTIPGHLTLTGLTEWIPTNKQTNKKQTEAIKTQTTTKQTNKKTNHKFKEKKGRKEGLPEGCHVGCLNMNVNRRYVFHRERTSGITKLYVHFRQSCYLPEKSSV